MPIYMILFTKGNKSHANRQPITSGNIDFINKPNKVMTLNNKNEIFGEIFRRSETRK